MTPRRSPKLAWATLWVTCLFFSIDGITAEPSVDNNFWESIFKGNRILDIHFTLTREAWADMQPEFRGRGEARPEPRRPDQRGPKERPPRPEFQPPEERGPANQGPRLGPRRLEGNPRPEPRRGRFGFGNDFPYAKADMTVDGRPFRDIGIRFKGNSSYKTASHGFKRPFKIDTNRFTKGLKLHGRTKLNFSNAFVDPAYMKEKLGYEIYRAAGLPTPGVGWAHVTLTIEGMLERKPLGLYVVIEQVDDSFLERRLGAVSRDSLLMKPEHMDDWRHLGPDPEAYGRYNIKEGEKETELIRKLMELTKLIEQAPDAEFEREIGKRMDLDLLAGYLAATSLLSSLDSFVGTPHNYYLLLDKADGKLKLLPWDVNETFGTFTTGNDPQTLAEWDIDRPWTSRRRVLERLFKTKFFPDKYRASLHRLLDGAFSTKTLFARVETFRKVLTPLLKNDQDGPGLEGLEQGTDGGPDGINHAERRRVYAIKPFITRRITSVKAQLEEGAEGRSLQRRSLGRRSSRREGTSRRPERPGNPGSFRRPRQ